MLICVDIDGTLTGQNVPQLVYTANRVLQLGIDEERLNGISSLKKFHALPELVAYKEKIGEDWYKSNVGWISYHPDVLTTHQPYPQAIEGTHRLLELGEVAYYTARYSPGAGESRNRGMRDGTLSWLKDQGFPNPEQVVFCDGLTGKLLQIAGAIAGKNKQPVVLIDDQYKRLLMRLEEIEPSFIQDTLHQYLTLVAYGAERIEEEAPISVIPLVSWSEIGSLFEKLPQGRKEAAQISVGNSSEVT